MRTFTAAACIATCNAFAYGQRIESSSSQAVPTIADPLQYDGRTFGGERLRETVRTDSLLIAGTRIHTWREGFGRDRAFGITERFAAQGDVLIELGALRLTATRAVAWVEPVGNSVLQIALVLEGVRSVGLDRAPTGTAAALERADRVLVTARLRDGENAITLRADDLVPVRPAARDMLETVLRAESRLAPFIRSLADASSMDDPETGAPFRSSERVGNPFPLPRPSAALAEILRAESTDDDAASETTRPMPSDDISLRVLRGALGTFSLSSPTVSVVDDGIGGKVVLLEDGVGVQFEGEGGSSRADLSARRGVVFLRNDVADRISTGLNATDIEGIYLEGGVSVTTTFGGASQFGAGSYSSRANRLYVDVSSRRMLMLDAVFWTYDERRGMPLYVRADAIRQLSETSWTAENALMTNVGFAEPHFSLGAESVVISRDTRADGSARTRFDAEGIGVRVGETPVLSLDGYSGELRALPLRSAEFESQDGDTVLRTEWDLFALLGIESEDAAQAGLLLDAYAQRGVGLGVDWSWQTQRSRGEVFGYWIHDYGEDRLSSGARIDRDGETRGVLDSKFMVQGTELWEIWGQLGLVSDPAFLDAFFEQETVTADEYAAGLRAERRSDNLPNLLVTADVRSSVNDFIPNEWLIQSRGYQSQRVPEFAAFATGLTPKGLPLTYFGEFRYGVYRLGLAENTPAEQGFDTSDRASEAFGLDPNTPISDQLRDRGLSESPVTRLDTRHELSAQLSAGPVSFTPFVVGRLTWWDDTFDSYNQEGGFGSGSQLDDQTRLWGAVGMRASTSVNTVSTGIRSDVFDLDGIRHIVEPTATVMFADSNVNQGSLPVFDEQVESLAEGTMTRLGITNTWQTKRGSAGDRFTVDWIVLDIGYVWSEDADDPDLAESSIGRWFDARPELSRLGEFIEGDITMALTNAVELSGSLVLDVANDTNVSRANVGIAFDHGYRSSSFIEYRMVDEPRVDSIITGFETEITEKYSLSMFAEWDLELDDLRTLGGRIERRFPQWTVRLGMSFDDIEDSVGLSVQIRPLGLGNERRRVRTRLAADGG